MLKKLIVGPIQGNCYILGCKETLQGAVIDPGDEVPRIVKEISTSHLSIKYILLTHGHFDHSGGAKQLKKIINAPVMIHQLDASELGFSPDGFLFEGQQLQVGKYLLTIFHTPGHSPGGVCIQAPGVVFTGDALFAGSIGRTDLYGGNHHQLISGIINKIFPLGDEVRVYPGHGPNSTIGRERRTNPWFTQGA
ncbi:MAG: MBL fold metallo-hydrolase [Thermodesulfobacteriota bacterium]|jgi:glyoxylase-like metal-dependent hydrolase (beta-lactamase superfamily II)|nr:MAG: MBL fold metallo-hydrolase [Thermodesulfobacteriota bacterium]